MAQKKQISQSAAGAGATFRLVGRVLVIEARFYDQIGDLLAEGAVAEIEAAGGEVDRVAVPGALEIPQVLARAAEAGLFNGAEPHYAGAVALGCVIRGETAHFDIVCNNANHWLMDVALSHGVALGNGILTVENEAQALERARGGRQGKGGDAARACLRMVEVAQQFGREGAAKSVSRSKAGGLR